MRRSSSTPPAALLQAQFGEDANQNHYGHHTTDDVDNEVGAVPVLVLLALSDSGHWLASVGPDGRIVVGADALVQPLLAELAAEAIETGTAAVQKHTSIAVEWWVPLAHDIIVTLATSSTDRRNILIVCVSPAGGSGQPCLQRSVLGGLHVGGGRLVGQRAGGNQWVIFSSCHRGDRRVLGEGRLSCEEGEEEEGEKVAGRRADGHHAEERRLRPTSYLLALDRKGEKFGDRRQTEITEGAS